MDVRNYHQEIRNDVVTFALDILASRPTCTLPDGAQLLKSLSEKVGRTRESLVLGAIPIKRELTWELQYALSLQDVFGVGPRQWRGVMEAVSKADRLIGRLHKDDQYGRFLFTEVARQRSRIVATECYEKKYADVKRSIQERFPSTID
jgi:hypothetical protein